MPYRKEEFVSLVVRTKPDGDQIVLKALRPTAEFYGWSEAFEPWRPRPVQGNRYTLIPDGMPGPWAPHFGGRRLRICRSPFTGAHPAGKTNAFRISSDGAIRDLAAIAAATKVEWHWMEDTRKRRIKRAAWMAFVSRVSWEAYGVRPPQVASSAGHLLLPLSAPRPS